jgi:hypothetical protein
MAGQPTSMGLQGFKPSILRPECGGWPRKNPKTLSSEAKHLSPCVLAYTWIEERFFASLRMTKQGNFSATSEAATHKD